MTLFEVFDRLELSALGAFIRDSVWLFPAIEAVHLLGYRGENNGPGRNVLESLPPIPELENR